MFIVNTYSGAKYTVSNGRITREGGTPGIAFIEGELFTPLSALEIGQGWTVRLNSRPEGKDILRTSMVVSVTIE